MNALNEIMLMASASKAQAGLQTIVRTNLLPNTILYRFACRRNPDRYFTGPWWIGYSPFESLKKYAHRRKQSLSLAARECLAIDWGWSDLDILIKVVLKKPLVAWSGTPKTQTPKKDGRYTGTRWAPDRDITQLLIPGLHESDPHTGNSQICQSAFSGKWFLNIE